MHDSLHAAAIDRVDRQIHEAVLHDAVLQQRLAASRVRDDREEFGARDRDQRTAGLARHQRDVTIHAVASHGLGDGELRIAIANDPEQRRRHRTLTDDALPSSAQQCGVEATGFGREHHATL